LFELDFRILETCLDVTMLRHKLISHNLANVETPGYKRRYVEFERYLQEAIYPRKIRLKRTDPRHLPNYEIVRSEVKVDRTTTFRNDDNNVDIDKEMVALAKNTMRYQVLSSLLSRKMERYNVVLRGLR